MAVPTSNISITSIYSEANGGSPGSGSNTNAGNLFKLSYFEGPAGNSTISYNAWGEYGNTSGANRIYGLTAGNSNNSFGDFSGKTYFYDNSTYKVAARVRNGLQAPPYPPPPPVVYDNNIVVEVWLYDSSTTYAYVASGAINANAQVGGFDNTFDLSNPFGSTPIIAIGYWEVRVSTNEFFPGGAKTIQIDINGTNYVNTGINPNGATTYSFSTYGSANVASTGQGYTGVYFDINVF